MAENTPENGDVVEEPQDQAAEAPETPAAPETPEAEAAEAPQAAADEVEVEGDAVLTDEDLEEVVEERPRQKPEIPGADLEVDIVREGEESYERSRWEEEGEEEPATDETDVEDLTQ